MHQISHKNPITPPLSTTIPMLQIHSSLYEEKERCMSKILFCSFLAPKSIIDRIGSRQHVSRIVSYDLALIIDLLPPFRPVIISGNPRIPCENEGEKNTLRARTINSVSRLIEESPFPSISKYVTSSLNWSLEPRIPSYLRTKENLRGDRSTDGGFY